MSTKMADTFLESKFLSLEDRLRAENEAPRINPTERMTLDFNTEQPFVRQGSGRRPGPRKSMIFQSFRSAPISQSPAAAL